MAVENVQNHSDVSSLPSFLIFFFLIFLNIYDCAAERRVELSHGLLPFPSRPHGEGCQCVKSKMRGGRKSERRGKCKCSVRVRACT